MLRRCRPLGLEKLLASRFGKLDAFLQQSSCRSVVDALGGHAGVGRLIGCSDGDICTCLIVIVVHLANQFRCLIQQVGRPKGVIEIRATFLQFGCQGSVEDEIGPHGECIGE